MLVGKTLLESIGNFHFWKEKKLKERKGKERNARQKKDLEGANQIKLEVDVRERDFHIKLHIVLGFNRLCKYKYMQLKV